MCVHVTASLARKSCSTCAQTQTMLSPVAVQVFLGTAGAVADPTMLLRCFSHVPLASEFFDGGQHDCQEVLRTLMNALHEDMVSPLDPRLAACLCPSGVLLAPAELILCGCVSKPPAGSDCCHGLCTAIHMIWKYHQADAAHGVLCRIVRGARRGQHRGRPWAWLQSHRSRRKRGSHRRSSQSVRRAGIPRRPPVQSAPRRTACGPSIWLQTTAPSRTYLAGSCSPRSSAKSATGASPCEDM